MVNASLRVGFSLPRVQKSSPAVMPRLAPVRIAAQPKEVFPGALRSTPSTDALASASPHACNQQPCL